MAIFSAEVEGLDELIKAFEKLGDEALPHITNASIEDGNVIIASAKTKIHDVSGELKKSLSLTKPSKKGSKYMIFSKVYFKPKGRHGVPVELGHKLVFMGHKTNIKVAAKPFLRPAADTNKNKVINDMSVAMSEAIEKMGGKK